MSRFDYVKYDHKAMKQQEEFKFVVTNLETMVLALNSQRARALALTKLEEFYMWIGKGIRDDQIQRNKETELQEERSDS